MEICNVANEVTGKKSVLHAKLLEIFKDQKEADLYYSKVLGDDFKKVFGDWEGKYKGTSSEKTGETYDTGEPKLFKKKNSNNWFFREQDGSIFPIKNLNPLRREFSPQDIKDISKFFLINFVEEGGAKSFNEMDAEKDQSKILSSIERTIASYREDIAELEDEDDIAEYTEKIDKVASYKTAWKDELVYQLDSLGQKFKERAVDAEGNPEGEVKEEDKRNGIEVKESITKNSKDTATVNTKIFLSQLVSKEINEDGELEDVYSGYLSTPVFEDFSRVWETLQPMLADKVTIESNEGVISAYSTMKKIVDSLHDVKPWARDLSAKLEALYNDNKGGRYKFYEFVQAFNKTKVNYYVTEFNAANSGYKIYNATATNSRESQILDRWGFRFQEKWLGDQIYLTDDKRNEIDAISNNVESIYKEWKNQVGLAGYDKDLMKEAYTEMTTSLFKELRDLGLFGLKNSDVNSLILLDRLSQNKYEPTEDSSDDTDDTDNPPNFIEDTWRGTTEKLFKGIRFMINDSITMVDDKGKGIKFTDDTGKAVNPMRSQKMIKMLAQAAALRELDIAESSILASGGKTYFAYSNPTYISNKIAEWKEDSSELDQLANQTINKHSKWLYYLRAAHITNNEKERVKESRRRLNELESGLASSFTSVGKDDGVDNTNISLGDQLNDNISKLLGSKLKGGVSYFPSIIAADKSRRVEFKFGNRFELFDSGIHNRTGELTIPPQTVDIFVEYFEDEYNRMKDVARDLKTMKDSDKIKHYHTGRMNGKKSQLFPEFSYDVIDKELGNMLYDKDGNPLESAGVPGFDQAQRDAVFNAVKKSLTEKYNDTMTKVTELSETTKINAKLVRAYKNKGGMEGLVGDYVVNGLMSSIEYTKIFSGDPAFYKDLPDLIKRIPATYTDGLQLALDSKDDMKFNTAIVQGVEVASQYQKVIYDSLKDKSIAKAYGLYKDGSGSDVNTTDAQAWITPRRWRFLKQRLGQWSEQHKEVFEAMESGKTLKDNQLKLAAQPLKGVYFEINNGVPTYLKYSQAVLIPAMVKGTPMEKLLYKMTHDKDGKELSATDETHEVITEDGIKVGAISPTKINEGDTTQLAEEFELNTHTLSNKGWKLQQDLPIKTMKETNLGSQIQKNILEGLRLDTKDTYKVFGQSKEKTGRELLQMVHDSISDLINIGAEEVSEKLGIDSGNKITDKSALYDVIINEFRERGGNENIIAALEKETPFDAIPQIRGRIDSILMSVFNRAITKIATEGGSFIQVSPFGLEKFDETSSIIKISDRYNGKGLLPPRRGEDGQTLPGQVLIPHTLAIKLLRQSGQNMSNMTKAKWKKIFADPKTRELVGYRIPNQGMSSNDTLEIVGILPETMGDSIVGYDGIPAKTGSDFDIDKMYIMAPNMLYNKKDEKFELINEENKQFYKGKKSTKKLIAQNTVLNLYSDILQSPHTYDNMMTSIDSGYLKEDIDKIHGTVENKNLDLFSPVTQLKIKDNYMSGKTGVGLTANQLVDHVANQSLSISVKANLGLGNVVGEGKKKTTEMDVNTKGQRSIADTLSAFLNAYVDIAKDNYITRGNHNDVTANVSFMLIRAGVPLETINRYIGQPILKELVELTKQAESITANPLLITNRDGSTKKATPYEFLRNKYGIDKYEKSQLQLEKITHKQFESRIRGNKNDFIDSVVLNAFEFHEKKAAQWTDAVLAAKIDVKGAGGSPITMNIAINKLNKVDRVGFVKGYESKFAGTSLGTYREKALYFTQDVLRRSDIVLSGTESATQFMNTASSAITKDRELVSEKLGKALDKGMYAYMMADSKIMKDNRRNFKYLFEKLPLELADMKRTSDNFLIQELEINKVGFYNFIGINGKNKPALYQNDIYRAWLDLYENVETEDLAVHLVRYAYSQSGFSANLNQFFTHIPHEILKDQGVNAEMNGFFQKIEDMATDTDVFLDQFYRHEADNTEVVPRANVNEFVELPGTDKMHGFGTTKSFADKYKRIVNGESYTKPPEFLTLQLEGEFGLYKIMNGEKDFDSEFYDANPIYIRTYKLGYKAGKNKVFEYSYGNKIKKSILPENQFEQDFINEVKRTHKVYENEYIDYREVDITGEDSSQQNFQEAENAETAIEELDGEEATGFKLNLSTLKKLGITKKDC